MDLIITDRTILHQISKEITQKEVYELNLISRLREANKTAWTVGAGLASIQIGIPVRFAWYFVNGKEGVLFNPVIINRWGNDTAKEGCLSIPNKYTEKERAWTIEYITNGKKKKANGCDTCEHQEEQP